LLVVFLQSILGRMFKSARVYYAPAEYESQSAGHWQGKTAVVLDILRATSTIVTALANGYRSVRCFREVADAQRCAAGHQRTVLAGERDGVPQEGFQYGNSPREFLRLPAGYDVLALTTTNGTRAVEAVSGAGRVVIASLLNLSAVAGYLRGSCAGSSLALVCSGSGEDFSLEDALVAGALLEELRIDHSLVHLFRAYADRLRPAFRASRNGSHLLAIGLADDVDWCLQRDKYAIVPLLADDGCIRAVHHSQGQRSGKSCFAG
jgi:2-phosphosulfolactate phosphatase